MPTQSGDIGLFSNTPVAVGQGIVQFFKYLSVAPLLLSLGRNGGGRGVGIWNAGYGHAGVYTVTGELAHCGAGGTVLELFNTEPAALFRLGAPEALRRRAGAIATRWSTGGQTGEWKATKAIAAAFGSSSYGSGARRRAAFYRQHANTQGGPPSTDGEGKKGWLCSMFTIACWQAALDDAQTEQFMKIDARYATPMTLMTYLENNPNWQRVN